MQIQLSVPATGVLLVNIDNFSYFAVFPLQDMLSHPTVINYNPLTFTGELAHEPKLEAKIEPEITGFIKVAPPVQEIGENG